MIKYAVALLFSGALLHAQENVQVGDELEIGKSETRMYQHIELPRANFIIKRGGIANYKALKGEKVVVTSIKENEDGSKMIKIKRKNGHRFFGSHPVVAVNYEKALESGEILTQ